jgi:hypothetical protein
MASMVPKPDTLTATRGGIGTVLRFGGRTKVADAYAH